MNQLNTSNPTQSSNNPLSVRNFRFLWLGEGISVLGDHFYLIALPWLGSTIGVNLDPVDDGWPHCYAGGGHISFHLRSRMFS